MTRQKKIERDKQIKALLFLFIMKQGYFDWWLDGDIVFWNVAKTLNCSEHKVKRVFWKDIYINNYNWLSALEY